MMVKRKKATPKGGRKPQGEFSQLNSPFSLRMPADLREQLEAAAKDSGRSVSQEMLDRLSRSFGRDHDKGRDPATRAICFLLAEVADKIRWLVPHKSWQHDSFLFRSFKIALAKVLDDIEPKGEAALDPRFARIMRELGADFETPEKTGLAAAMRVLSDFHGRSIDPRVVWQKIIESEEDPSRRDIQLEQARREENTFYGMPKAWRDLQGDNEIFKVTETGGNNGKHT
jgi:hypothetical protein